MRYLEILEAASAKTAAINAEKQKSAREQIATADAKRADAARNYHDQLNAARSAASKARAKLRASSISEAEFDPELDCVQPSLVEGLRSYALRDRNGVLLGWIEAVGRLIQAKDRTGTIIGWYDPRQNQTRDRTGTIIGTGDFLSALVVSKGQL